MATITAQRAREYNIDSQQKHESDNDFRHRVSAEIRAKGHYIEAHEAMQNALYDDPSLGGDVMTGIIGAMAQAIKGKQYSRNKRNQVGDDIAAGVVAQSPKDDSAGVLGLLSILLS